MGRFAIRSRRRQSPSATSFLQQRASLSLALAVAVIAVILPAMKNTSSRSKSMSRESARANVAAFLPRASHAELYEKGKSLRKRCPRSSHGVWKAGKGRPDPIELVKQANTGRIPELVPIRHTRMMHSPFTFYRGTALNMAADLGTTPATGLLVQACGDAHLGNFRCFGTPERRVIFDIHDLDETLPAPWEWDVKRLAASFLVACRNNGLSDRVGRETVLTCVRNYREQMLEFSSMTALDVWYRRVEAEALVDNMACKRRRRRLAKTLARARERSAFEHDFPKLAHKRAGLPAIREHPPTIFHWRDHNRDCLAVQAAFQHYRKTLPYERRNLLDRFQLHDLAINVVGVGSVATFCFVLLLMAEDEDPLFLQVKEARTSVLEPFAGASIFRNQGERVVTGHRLMQSASDIFLGWTASMSGRNYYIRQLRDVKVKFDVERFDSQQMMVFAKCCGLTLARAHARSGEPAAISGYLGKGDVFDKAIADFAIAYADQAERDYESFRNAIHNRRLRVSPR